MQFRKVGISIQCLIGYWDKESKRSRQKSIYLLPLYMSDAKDKPTIDDLADYGTEDQRKQWAKEIGEYSDKMIEDFHAGRTRNSVLLLESAAETIAKDRAGPTSALNEDAVSRAITAVSKLATALGLDVKTPRKPATSRKTTTSTSTDPRAFGPERVNIAKEHRAAGLSVAATAARMTADGHPVGKSWVQKWTAKGDNHAN